MSAEQSHQLWSTRAANLDQAPPESLPRSTASDFKRHGNKKISVPSSSQQDTAAKMPTSLHKTRKIISKKRGGVVNSLHAKSRDSMRLRLAHARDIRLEKQANARAIKEEPIVDRIEYFHNYLKEKDVTRLELPEVQTLIHNYVHQHDEELNEVKKARRPGRPASNREDQLKRKVDTLEEEYEKGFLIPNVFDEDNSRKLMGYEGSWAYIATIAWSKVSKAGKISNGDFPSKGIM
ncbi:hypothetical protein LLEC1_04005 [Akanthomyces lecanii]|uniref:Translation machinery-associated protein 16 n=1 Tax=Cordyceps confragosa TaxID=2714763 RepID=A0A179IIR4_CORDF|nr:hypothetical protein LLEC1_04005 [Akanthomyces lecanii]